MTPNTNLTIRTSFFGRNIFIAMVLAMGFAACRDGVTDTVPAELPGTTWKFDDFYITFVSTSAIKIHTENAEDVLAEGTYSIVDEFIEVELDDRVRAGSWDGERLTIDGMVGRLTTIASQ